MSMSLRKASSMRRVGFLRFLCLFVCYHVLLLCQCRSYTALGVKFMDFHGDFYCFIVYICPELLPIFQTELQSGSSIENVRVIVLGLYRCSRPYLGPIIIISKCIFVNDQRPNLVIQGKKKALAFSMQGVKYIYKQTKTLHLTIELDTLTMIILHVQQ